MMSQLVLELAADARGDPSVALAGAGAGQLAQVADRRLAGRQRIVGEAVAEVVEGELAPLGDAPRVGERVRAVAEQRRHLARRLEMALGVGQQAAPGGVQGGLLAQAGEHVEQRAPARQGVAHVVGGDERNAVPVRQRRQGAVESLLGRVEVALQIDVQAAGEEALQAAQDRAGALLVAAPHRLGQGAVGTARQADQSLAAPFEILPEGAGLPLRRALLGVGQQPAQVAIAGALGDQEIETGEPVSR